MKNIFKKIICMIKVGKLILLSLIIQTDYCRIFFSPLPTYYVPNSQNIFGDNLYINETNSNKYGLQLFSTFYTRSSNSFFTNNNTIKNFSALFHGDDIFKFNNIFSDPINEFDNFVSNNNSIRDALNNINVQPIYSYNETGCILGLQGTMNLELNEKNFTIKYTTKIPFKKVQISNDNYESCISSEIIGKSSSELLGWYDERIENGKPVFAARLDKLHEYGIVNLKNVDKIYFGLNPSLNNIDYSIDSNNLENPNMSIQTISKGNVAINTPLGLVFDTPQSCNLINDTIVWLGDTYSTTPTSNNSVAGETIIPLINFGHERFQPQFFNQETINVSPIIQTSTLAKNKCYYTDFSQVNIIGSINNENEISIVTNVNGAEVNYYNPGIVVQYNSKFPKSYGRKIEIEDQFPESDLYNPTAIENLKTCAIVNEDGTINNSRSNLPGIFWYMKNYEKLFDKKNLKNVKDLYLTTAIGNDSEPTLQSVIFQSAIRNVLNTLPEADDSSYEAERIAKKITQGYFKNGPNQSQQYQSNEFLNSWQDFNYQGFDDIDYELTFGTTFYESKIAGDLLLGFTVPIGELFNPKKPNYLCIPFGNNGHYEFRVGGKLGYEVNNNFVITGYAHYGWALSEKESFFAPFGDATNSSRNIAYGLQPVITSGDISWKNFIGSIDCTILTNSNCGIGFLYQYMYKTKDVITLNDKNLKDALNNTYPLDKNIIEKNSQRSSHKIGFNFIALLVNDMKISLGYNGIVEGNNIPRENDYFVTVGIDF
jgi:hypothetical protein